jgi:hypothetical protein
MKHVPHSPKELLRQNACKKRLNQKRIGARRESSPELYHPEYGYRIK